MIGHPRGDLSESTLWGSRRRVADSHPSRPGSMSSGVDELRRAPIQDQQSERGGDLRRKQHSPVLLETLRPTAAFSSGHSIPTVLTLKLFHSGTVGVGGA